MRQHNAVEPPNTGLLLVSHGTRDPRGVAEARMLARLVAESFPAAVVELGFIELAQPTVTAAVDRLAERGARQVVIVPLLLIAAGHANRDVPQMVADAKRRHPQLRFAIAGRFGLHPRVLELSQLRFREALAERPPLDRNATLLLLVGRGSTVPAANREFVEFARRRGELDDVGTEPCFAALSEPTLASVIRDTAAAGWGRVVVQPHLLFEGQLLGDIAVQVAAAAHRGQEWILTPHLGPHELLAAAVLDRARSAEWAADEQTPVDSRDPTADEPTRRDDSISVGRSSGFSRSRR